MRANPRSWPSPRCWFPLAEARSTSRSASAGPLDRQGRGIWGQLKNGAEQEIPRTWANAAGGINEQKVELVVGDDAADLNKGRAVANTFVGEGVSFGRSWTLQLGADRPTLDVYRERNPRDQRLGSTNRNSPTAGL